jgi:uncharacterized protein (TIGR03083 family)
MDPMTGLRHTRTGIEQVRLVLADGDLDAGIPGCPGWTLRGLGLHLGEIHRWVRGAIVEGHPDTAPAPGPSDRVALLDWYDEGATALLDLLGRTDPQTPCWAFGPKPATARFWFRRQAHEHAVHVRDAQASQGEATTPIDAELAVDGVDEVVSLFFPRQVRRGRMEPLTRSLAVRPFEAGGASWLLAGAGTEGKSQAGAVPTPAEVEAEAEAEATVTGPAEALYLLLWRRVRLDDPRLELVGDRTAAEAVLGSAIVP